MSESEKCMSVGKNFSRREWLMLIVILLMLEAGALISSHVFMSNQDVINYISFASTIASLLLAVLAIVYGFYQSESQKRSGDGIEVHLSNLRRAADEIKIASSDLRNDATKISGASSELEKISASLEITQEKLGAIQGGVEGVSENYNVLHQFLVNSNKKTSNNNETFTKNNDSSVARAILLNNPAHTTIICAYAIFIAVENDKENEFSVKEIIFPFAKALHESEFLSLSEVTWMQTFAMMLSIFRSANLLKYNQKKGEELGMLKLQEGAFEILQKVAANVENTSELEKASKNIKTEIQKKNN